MGNSPQPELEVPRQAISIAFLITDLDAGGAERALVQILKHLDRGRWNPRVFCLGPEAELVASIRDLGIPVECYGARHSVSFPWAIWWAVRRLREHRPKLLQCFLFHANIVGRFAGRLAGVPVVLAGHRVAEREKRWHLAFERWTKRLVDHHVCVSRGVADHLCEKAGISPEQVTIIPNGVEIDDPLIPVNLAEVFEIPPQRKVILAAGRLHRQKGFDLLIEAFAPVHRNDPDTHLLIVGEGPEREALLARVAKLELEQFVSMPGRREDLRGIMAASSLFVLPSRWEGMPNVVLEAMSVGLPVISAPVEGIGELIVDGVHGIVTSPEKTVEFADRMTLLLNDSTRRQNFALESQRLVKTKFTWINVAADYGRLFERMLKLQQN